MAARPVTANPKKPMSPVNKAPAYVRRQPGYAYHPLRRLLRTMLAKEALVMANIARTDRPEYRSLALRLRMVKRFEFARKFCSSTA